MKLSKHIGESMYYNGVELKVGQVWRYQRSQASDPKYRIIDTRGRLPIAEDLSDGSTFTNLDADTLLANMELDTDADGTVTAIADGPAANVLHEVQRERQRQDSKWGQQNHGPMVWLGILAEEFGEVAKDANDFHFSKDVAVQLDKGRNYRAELIQVAAVAVAMVESFDRNEGYRGEDE